MDKALVYGTRDSGFDPQRTHLNKEGSRPRAQEESSSRRTQPPALRESRRAHQQKRNPRRSLRRINGGYGGGGVGGVNDEKKWANNYVSAPPLPLSSRNQSNRGGFYRFAVASRK
nr:unnamed protein product [Digitaria exilis]